MQRFCLSGGQQLKQIIMRITRSFLLLLPALFFLLISCNKEGVQQRTKDLVLPANATPVIDASGSFAFKFFKEAVADNDDKNILVSPLSIYMAFSMVYNGADNATKDAIAKALQVQGIAIEDINATCKALIEQLPEEDSKVKLSIANSIWYRNNGPQPLPAFLDVTRQYFNASVTPLDFANPSAVSTINNWVTDKTNNKITKIIEAISGDALMYLINAIYFNGSWQYAFKSSDTYTGQFKVQGENAVSVSFMKQRILANNTVTDDFDVIELPYGGGKGFSMYILLPLHQATPVNTLAAGLTDADMKNAIGRMRLVDRTIIIPKWEYAYSVDDLKPALSTLGMSVAFSDGADFSKMYATSVAITKALHKTYIKVSEEGTEAAAVTSVEIGPTSVAPGFEFKADHPFIYVIAEKQTGSVLFTGIVRNPSLH